MIKDIVISRLVGGLGNQMFQFACGYALSQKLHARLLLDKNFLVIKPADPNYTLRDFELDVFKLRPEFVAHDLAQQFKPSDTSLLQKIRNKVLGTNPGYFRENSKLFSSEIFQLHTPVYLDGYWQNEKYFSEYRLDLINLFQPQIPPSELNQRLATEIAQTSSVCVHVRRGDYVSNPSASQLHGNCSPSYYENAAKWIEMKGTQLSYYVFSDDPGWVRENIHFPENTKYIDHNTGKESHWDLFLMKHGQHHIIANSSFSWWGAWLCERPGQLVVAPSRWFQGIEQYEITPSAWFLI